jgi:protein-S-isoprenylcysteine O-methyltransferase Ste14
VGRAVLARFGLVLAVVAAALFVPAGTTDYWQAWLWIGTWLLPAAGFFAFYLRHDPETLARRIQSREEDPAQRRLIRAGVAISAVVYLLPGFDRRFGWSSVPPVLSIAADAVVLAGYLLFVLVMRENRYASRTIRVEEGQRVITTGPYAHVRHPMYVSMLLINLSSPVALGSWYAAAPALLFVPMVVARLLLEEKTLARDLPGYAGYLRERKYRLIPGVW